MNKNEFIRAFADNLGSTIKEANEVFETFEKTLTQCLKNGEYVHISNFAKFSVVAKNARNVTNPGDGKIMTIPACYSPVCKFLKPYKDKFNTKD